MRSLSLILLGASTLLGAATLPAQPPVARGTGTTTQTDPRARDGADRRRDGMNRGRFRGDTQGGRRGFRGGRGGDRLALRGITLTDAQRTQLRAIGDRYRDQRRALHDEARAQWGGRRAAPNAAPGDAPARPDSAARAAFRTRVRDLQQRQLNDVRGVLTRDQQATFDRNVTELRTRMAERGGEFGGERGRGRGFRGPR